MNERELDEFLKRNAGNGAAGNAWQQMYKPGEVIWEPPEGYREWYEVMWDWLRWAWYVLRHIDSN